MDGRETSREIERAATQWVARMDRAPLSRRDEARLQRWLAGDARRAGALMRAKALWHQARALQGTGQLHALAAPPPRTPVQVPASPRRRAGRGLRPLRWASALAASLVLTVFLLLTVQVPAAYATTKGEMRRVALAGGSVLTLNTDTRVKVHDDGGQLRVAVERGEVFIDARNARPDLVVEVDRRRMTARNATLLVRKLDGEPTHVSVETGALEIPSTATTVAAATRLLLRDGPDGLQLSPLPSGQLQREMAWREGKIAFEGETLAEAVADFARYSDLRIDILDNGLAQMPITGLFDANDPEGFGNAVAQVFDADARRERDRVVLSRPVEPARTH